MVQLIECPRDAMQGLNAFIPTEQKIKYINQLLKVGFHTIDFGSFVSPKAIPQMRDTADVVRGLDLRSTKSRLLAIVANERGARDACQFEEITFLGYPFSISETFQLRNTNATIKDSVSRVQKMVELTHKHDKELVVYISMGFGNPYGDEWNADIVKYWVSKLVDMGIQTLSLSDTIGVANPESIRYLFGELIPGYPEINFGAHLHTQRHKWKEKVEAAYQKGCRRFDSAIQGFGGCPMAKDDLTGNMQTENLLSYFDEVNAAIDYDRDAFLSGYELASKVFPKEDHGI
ncbi:MAG: hydroxymethylglutaryl-CoA lyase [Bacteroidetes bacterium]|jgi:hydroxymethylglutaryl-CoA lyase|nr:hydroxymethylglutaryl-CoA lyase [Bacteroidota bacterium]